MSASWTVVKDGKLLAAQEGDQFAPEFGKLLEVHLNEILRKGNVHGVLTVQKDGTIIFVLTASEVPYGTA